MKPLFDFGISQEDAFSEQRILDIRSGDKILCIASGGEVPLNLLSMNENIRMEAIDISGSQLALCRLKLLSALHIDFPLNAGFLGYSPMNKKTRRKIFDSIILPLLEKDDKDLWLNNMKRIENGIVNSGRFERFIRNLRPVARLVIGKKNIAKLINCSLLQEQQELFDQKIGKRRSLKYLFRIAFHPWVYKKRGLDKQGLIHASTNTGEKFFNRFRDFCTETPAGENYFLQYFLNGTCAGSALPEFLKPAYRETLKKNKDHISFRNITINEAMDSPGNDYNKIHLSNVGDWMSSADFKDLMKKVVNALPNDGKVSCRFLQKDHFSGNDFEGIRIDKKLGSELEKKDRFPFYSLVPIRIVKT